jgi:hypothetical protein
MRQAVRTGQGTAGGLKLLRIDPVQQQALEGQAWVVLMPQSGCYCEGCSGHMLCLLLAQKPESQHPVCAWWVLQLGHLTAQQQGERRVLMQKKEEQVC